MTVGEKIKYYRTLNGLTQKELGKKALGTIGDSSLRIYKYENDVMAPKANYRESIANALNVDVEALSDIDIQSNVDIMHILFLLENTQGLRVHRENGKVFLSFDETGNTDEELLTFLNFWENAASKEKDTTEKQTEYELWKGRFSQNVKDYLNRKEAEIEDYYRNYVSRHEQITPYAKTTSDITNLLRKIIEAGLTVTTSTSNHSHTTNFTFVVNELLNPPTEDAANLFGQFLSEMKHLNDLIEGCSNTLQMPSKTLTITYSVPLPGFNIIHVSIKELQQFLDKEEKADYDIEDFETGFQMNLKSYFNVIEKEIEDYGIPKKS